MMFTMMTLAIVAALAIAEAQAGSVTHTATNNTSSITSVTHWQNLSSTVTLTPNAAGPSANTGSDTFYLKIKDSTGFIHPYHTGAGQNAAVLGSVDGVSRFSLSTSGQISWANSPNPSVPEFFGFESGNGSTALGFSAAKTPSAPFQISPAHTLEFNGQQKWHVCQSALINGYIVPQVLEFDFSSSTLSNCSAVVVEVVYSTGPVSASSSQTPIKTLATATRAQASNAAPQTTITPANGQSRTSISTPSFSILAQTNEASQRMANYDLSIFLLPVILLFA